MAYVAFVMLVHVGTVRGAGGAQRCCCFWCAPSPWYRELEQIIPGIPPPPVPSSDTLAQRLAGEVKLLRGGGRGSGTLALWRHNYPQLSACFASGGPCVRRDLAMRGIYACAVQAAGLLASPTSDTAGGD